MDLLNVCYLMLGFWPAFVPGTFLSQVQSWGPLLQSHLMRVCDCVRTTLKAVMLSHLHAGACQ